MHHMWGQRSIKKKTWADTDNIVQNMNDSEAL